MGVGHILFVGSVARRMSSGAQRTVCHIQGRRVKLARRSCGAARYASGSLPGCRGYTGQRSDAATSGLDYYGACYYDPAAGQFTSADTTLAGGLNRYAYVGGNPETWVNTSSTAKRGIGAWRDAVYGIAVGFVVVETPARRNLEVSRLGDFFRPDAHWILAESDHAVDLQRAENTLTSEPQASDALTRKTEALLGLDRYDEALPIALQLVEDHIDSSSAWLLLCRALRGLGYVELALRANAAAAARTAPDFETDRFGGDTLFDSERYEEANAAYQSALHRWGEEPPAWELWLNVATCMEEAGRSADARSANQQALRLLQQVLARNSAASQKQHAAMLNALGNLYFRLERYPQAKRALSDSAVADGRGTAIYWLARTFREEGIALAALPYFPWILRNLWAEERARRDGRERMLEQRAAVTPEYVQRIEALIAH